MADWSWSQSGQGAAGGALAGASIGAIGGPIGAGIGAGIGGLAGFIGGGLGGDPRQSYQDQLKALADKYGARQAPQAGMSDFRSNQAGLISQLEAASRGEGPSAAQLQMQQAMDRAAGAQASAAAGAGGRGVNAGAALRQAMNNTAAVQQGAARDTSILRAQEQATARQQLGSVINQARGSDEQMNQFNVTAMLQQLGLNDESQLKALTAALGSVQPGLGTQLMAGGASAFPSALQYLKGSPGQ
jgi:hypothetical protein